MKTQIRLDAERAVFIDRLVRAQKPRIAVGEPDYPMPIRFMTYYHCMDSWAAAGGRSMRQAYLLWRERAAEAIEKTVPRKMASSKQGI